MNRKIYVLTLFIFCNLCFVQITQADEISELKAHMELIQKQLDAQTQQIKIQDQLIREQGRIISEMQGKVGPLQIEGAEEVVSTQETDWADKVEVGYKKGIYVKTKDDQHSLHWRFLSQPRYDFISTDDAEDTNTFMVKRAQVRMFGNVLNPSLTYKFMIQANSSSSGEGGHEFA